MNLNLHSASSGYSTVPVKLRSQRKRTKVLSAYCADTGVTDDDLDFEVEIAGNYNVFQTP